MVAHEGKTAWQWFLSQMVLHLSDAFALHTNRKTMGKSEVSCISLFGLNAAVRGQECEPALFYTKYEPLDTLQ